MGKDEIQRRYGASDELNGTNQRKPQAKRNEFVEADLRDDAGGSTAS